MYIPTFSITNSILKNIGSIEAAREVIENAPLLPYWEKKFQDEAVVRTVHYGTHIEGNELSLTQVQKILDGENIVARSRDVQCRGSFDGTPFVVLRGQTNQRLQAGQSGR
jgi:hypothetical protein